MEGHRIGYVRVDKMFIDKALGKDTQRPQLDALLMFVREGGHPGRAQHEPPGA